MFTYHLFLVGEHKQIIDIINRVTAEGKFLQTENYVPTFDWESVLERGVNRQSGRLIIVVRVQSSIIGFCRLFPAEGYDRKVGSVGIVLLPEHRHKRVGTRLLKLVVAMASDYGYGTLTADILADNFISLRLFQRQGFTEHSRRKLCLTHWDAVVEEIRMQLFLPKGVKETNVQLSND